jgi:SAM-dependent methyltransferase
MSLDAVKRMRLNRIIDIGCGAGQEMLPFISAGKVQGVGIDIVPEAGLVGRQLYLESFPQAKVSFVRASAEGIPFDTGAFDLAICRIALAYMDNRAVLGEISRVLRPNGILLLKIMHARYYVHEAWRGLKDGDLRRLLYACKVLCTGAIYHLSGHQVRGLANGETFQTRWMLRRELSRCGMEETVEIADDDILTPSFVIIKTGAVV